MHMTSTGPGSMAAGSSPAVGVAVALADGSWSAVGSGCAFVHTVKLGTTCPPPPGGTIGAEGMTTGCVRADGVVGTYAQLLPAAVGVALCATMAPVSVTSPVSCVPGELRPTAPGCWLPLALWPPLLGMTGVLEWDDGV